MAVFVTQGNLLVTGCCHFLWLTFWLGLLDSLRRRRSGCFSWSRRIVCRRRWQNLRDHENGSIGRCWRARYVIAGRPVRWPRHAGSIVIGRLGRAV